MKKKDDINLEKIKQEQVKKIKQVVNSVVNENKNHREKTIYKN